MQHWLKPFNKTLLYWTKEGGPKKAGADKFSSSKIGPKRIGPKRIRPQVEKSKKPISGRPEFVFEKMNHPILCLLFDMDVIPTKCPPVEASYSKIENPRVWAVHSRGHSKEVFGYLGHMDASEEYKIFGPRPQWGLANTLTLLGKIQHSTGWRGSSGMQEWMLLKVMRI